MDSDYLATNETSQKFQIVEYMVSLSFTTIRGGKISDVGDEGAPGYRGGMAVILRTKKD